jgi:large subunit ribosomal protein L3
MINEEKDNKENLEEVPAEESAEATPEEVPAEESAEAAPEEVPAEESAEAAPEEVPVEMKDYSQVSIFGKKIGMSRIFLDEGNHSCPVTVIEAGPCYVTQIKTKDSDGYDSIQISYGKVKENKINKASKGHYSKSKTAPMKFLKEFRVDSVEDFNLGDKILASAFSEGDLVGVSGRSIGRGFAGHMKRHGFGGGRKSHGKNSVMRKAGSIGAGSDPSRVWKGTRMAGRMGFDNVSIKNLSVVRVDASNNLIYLKGSVPGSNKGLVFITK